MNFMVEMSAIKKVWQKIQKYPIDIWFFYLFLLTFTLNVRKVVLYFPLKGTFNEYTGIYVYMSDLFLFLAVFFWILSIIYNKLPSPSISKLSIFGLIHKKKCLF